MFVKEEHPTRKYTLTNNSIEIISDMLHLWCVRFFFPYSHCSLNVLMKINEALVRSNTM